jgi:putative flavoprotein involved in K+ transport
MAVERVNTLVVGAGQAGIAASEHLSANGVPHLVVERSRIAERWRSERWDSLVQNGPVWHDRFPNMEFAGFAPDEFAGKEAVADYFVEYADKINAPIRCGVEVTSVEQKPGGGFIVETSTGTIEADNLIAATGPFQKPLIPTVVPEEAGIMQIHSSGYRNPDQLPKVPCLWSVPGHPARRLPTSWRGQGARSISPSVHMTVRRAAIAERISSGGSACWANGT